MAAVNILINSMQSSFNDVYCLSSNIVSRAADQASIALRSSLLRHAIADASIALVMTQSQPSVSSASLSAMLTFVFLLDVLSTSVTTRHSRSQLEFLELRRDSAVGKLKQGGPPEVVCYLP